MSQLENKNEAGFTLLETIFTLLLISIMFTITMPTINNVCQRIEHKLILDQLCSDLQLAQKQAVSRSQEVIAEFTERGIYFYQGSRLLKKYSIPKKYRLETNYREQKLIFFKSGHALGGCIKLLHGNKNLGEIKMQVGSGRTKLVMFNFGGSNYKQSISNKF